MSSALRLFVGVALTDEVRAALARELEAARMAVDVPSELRWLAPETWHITLQFLGGVPEAEVDRLRAACRRAALACAPFAIEFGAYGAFSSVERAGVVWLGPSRGAEHLVQLGDAVSAQTEPLGFLREARAFHPHVTLARQRPARDLRALLASLAPPALAVQVDALVLFRSWLGTSGARYEMLERVPLARADDAAP